MVRRRILEFEWPELNMKVQAEPLNFNNQVYEWFLDNCPLRGVQSHAMVSGKLLYILNLPLKKPLIFDPNKVVRENLKTKPIGRVHCGALVTGLVGSVSIKYGEVTEDMTSGIDIAQVKDADMEILRKVGEAVWNSIYYTKEIITCNIKCKEE